MTTTRKSRINTKFTLLGCALGSIGYINAWAQAQGYNMVSLTGGHEPCKYSTRLINECGDLEDLELELYGRTPRVISRVMVVKRSVS